MEHLSNSPEPLRPLEYAAAWQELQDQDDYADYQLTLTGLVKSTQQACEDLLNPPTWAADAEEVTYRWRLAVEEVAHVALSEDVLDNASDDVEILKRALKIVRDNTLDAEKNDTEWHKEGLALRIINADTEEEQIVDLRDMVPEASAVGRLQRRARILHRKWDEAGRPGPVTLTFWGLSVGITLCGSTIAIADGVFDAHLADKMINVDIMPDSAWPTRVGQATVQCIGEAAGGDRDIDCKVFEVIFGDG